MITVKNQRGTNKIVILNLNEMRLGTLYAEFNDDDEECTLSAQLTTAQLIMLLNALKRALIGELDEVVLKRSIKD